MTPVKTTAKRQEEALEVQREMDMRNFKDKAKRWKDEGEENAFH